MRVAAFVSVAAVAAAFAALPQQSVLFEAKPRAVAPQEGIRCLPCARPVLCLC